MIAPDGNIVDFPEGDDAVVRDEQYRVFYTVNSAGAIGYTTVKAERIDAENPVITIESQGGSDLGISVMDDVFEEDLSDMELYLRYDDPSYRAVLAEYGLLTDDDGFFKIEEFSQSEFGVRPENTAMGILEYTGSLRPADGQIYAGMMFTAPAGSGGYTGTVSMYVVDRVGHQSDIVTAAMNIPEIKFTENDFVYNRDNHPFGPEKNIVLPYYSVSLENPAEMTEPKLTDRGIRGEINTDDVFQEFHEAMPIYKDGKYTLTVKDHFGDGRLCDRLIDESRRSDCMAERRQCGSFRRILYGRHAQSNQKRDVQGACTKQRRPAHRIFSKRLYQQGNRGARNAVELPKWAV